MTIDPTLNENPVLLSLEKDVAYITLNRPKILNALNADMAEGLLEALTRCNNDSSVRCVVIQGAGPAFMAGGDIGMFHKTLNLPSEKRPAVFYDFIGSIHPAIELIHHMAKPVIASIHGPVAGFGVSLTLACDFIIGADSAVITLAYCQLGLSPDGGATYSLVRAVGVKRAMSLCLLSQPLTAHDATQLGLIHTLVPEEERLQHTKNMAEKLATGPTQAFARTKALIHHSLETPLKEQLQAEQHAFSTLTGTYDFEEGVRGFLEKRPRTFKGL